MNARRRVIVVYEGGPKDGERDDLTDVPGFERLERHPTTFAVEFQAPEAGTSSTGVYVLAGVEGDVGRYQWRGSPVS